MKDSAHGKAVEEGYKNEGDNPHKNIEIELKKQSEVIDLHIGWNANGST